MLGWMCTWWYATYLSTFSSWCSYCYTCSRWRQRCASKWIRKGPWAHCLAELWSCSQHAGVWKIWQVFWGKNQSDSLIINWILLYFVVGSSDTFSFSLHAVSILADSASALAPRWSYGLYERTSSWKEILGFLYHLEVHFPFAPWPIYPRICWREMIGVIKVTTNHVIYCISYDAFFPSSFNSYWDQCGKIESIWIEAWANPLIALKCSDVGVLGYKLVIDDVVSSKEMLWSIIK